MTSPRREIYDPAVPGYYHCFSRCVRRAYLCGYDTVSGRSYEHRREWIRGRLSFLRSLFAIEVATYAIMHNHLHTILRTRPDLALAWSDKEVARRWLMLFSRKKFGRKHPPTKEAIHAITHNPLRVALYRERLASLSWFHRALNEAIARRANQEDGCSGRFWEGRFRSEALTSAESVVACSVYVDLNPIRARIATTPEQSAFTGVAQRIRERSRRFRSPANQKRVPLLSVETFSDNTLTQDEYLALVDETGRIVRKGKGSIPKELLPILERLSIKREGWLVLMSEKRQLFRRAVGPVASLKALAEKFGKRWLHGVTGARRVFASSV